MPGALGILRPLVWLGLIAAVLALTYFVVGGLQRDHQTSEYHFTWGVGVVALFLLGFAPGFVGLGLYLTVEKHYPIHWLVLCLFVVIFILLVTGTGIFTDTEAGVLSTHVLLSSRTGRVPYLI